MKKSDIKKWVEGVHLLGIITFFIGPLVVYFALEEKEIKKSAKVALNWQFSLLIYMAVASLLSVGNPYWMMHTGFLYFWGGNVLMNILVIINIIFCLIAFSKATRNEMWKYPLSIKFFKN